MYELQTYYEYKIQKRLINLFFRGYTKKKFRRR